MRRYPAFIRQEADSDYGVDFPDFPGCVTAGKTLEEARQMAAEALALHVAGLIEDGEALPDPSPLDQVMTDPHNADAVAFLVSCDPDRRRGRRKGMRNPDEYPFEMRRLAEDEGGGWLITYPDLPGCMSDGETPEEAIRNGRDAVMSWLKTAEEHGDPIPEPGKGASGRVLIRLPKSLHARISARAKSEGVSMNTLTVSLLAEGIGRSAPETAA